MNMSLGERYIKAKYKGATRSELLELQNDAADELSEIKKNKDDVFEEFQGIHGRFQQSQLDVLDTREQKTQALFDNVEKMLLVAKD